MKTYKELSEMMERKIDKLMRRRKPKVEKVTELVDVWIAFMARDKETPEIEKCKKVKKVAEFIEKRMESPKGDKKGGWFMGITFTYIALREYTENEGGEERRARALQLIP